MLGKDKHVTRIKVSTRVGPYPYRPTMFLKSDVLIRLEATSTRSTLISRSINITITSSHEGCHTHVRHEEVGQTPSTLVRWVAPGSYIIVLRAPLLFAPFAHT